MGQVGTRADNGFPNPTLSICQFIQISGFTTSGAASFTVYHFTVSIFPSREHVGFTITITISIDAPCPLGGVYLFALSVLPHILPCSPSSPSEPAAFPLSLYHFTPSQLRHSTDRSASTNFTILALFMGSRYYHSDLPNAWSLWRFAMSHRRVLLISHFIN